MVVRPHGLDLCCSLRSALGNASSSAVEAAAARQERTIDAVLLRLYDSDHERRREIVLLADEVGLGKTFVALGVAWSVLHQRSSAGLSSGPVLVITPHAHALFKKWAREAERFLQLVAPPDMSFDVEAVSTPHELARALRKRRPTLVIARMSALSGRLHQADTARMAAIHTLLRMDGFDLSLNNRLAMLSDWSYATHESLDLRRSSSAWEAAKSADKVGFDDVHLRVAWRRLEATDPLLCRRMEESWRRVRQGHQKHAAFWKDLREICRAAIGQTVPHHVPLVIVDEIHNWKNHPRSWQRFVHMLGLRIDRLLGLSATPFQLGPHELIQVLNLRSCIQLPPERADFLTKCVSALGADVQAAQAAGESLREFWAEVNTRDVNELERTWTSIDANKGPDALPPRMQNTLSALLNVREAHSCLSRNLRPFMVRHRRDSSHRAWWVGREADPEWSRTSVRRNALRSQPGLDVGGDAELVHYLMMRAVQEQKKGRGSTSLGADLGGSYAFFRDAELRRMLPGNNEEARRYLGFVKHAVSGDTHEHPKVSVTAERAFHAWCNSDKTLVFCFNVATVGSIQAAVNSRIDTHTTNVLTAAFDCTEDQLETRLKNLQRRLYNYRQSVFLLFQDHPFAGPNGRLPRRFTIRENDIRRIAERLARAGPPHDRSRFDRRRVLAATEQTLLSRWEHSAHGLEWLEKVLKPLQLEETISASIQMVSAPDWHSRRREVIEGILRDAEVEALPDDEDIDNSGHRSNPEDVAAWKQVLEGRAGQTTLGPYLGEPHVEVPSLLTRYHSAALASLPARLRALAARMLRRMVRSPGFLARFILNDPSADPHVEDDTVDDNWTSLIHRRYDSAPASGESARARFDAYLETLQKAVGLEEQVSAYQEASRNREVVARVTGAVPSYERDRLFMGFNSPLVPEVLIVTTVGQEGIDLHRECRHVIHHDLPWNPATLEQRTGRVDRIGSKTERLRSNENGDCFLDVVVPYIAGTYDEHRFRVVHGRAHIFDVTMGGKYAVDGHRSVLSPSDSETAGDELGEPGVAWIPVPETIATDLRVHLEAEPTGGGVISAVPASRSGATSRTTGTNRSARQ